MMTGGSVLKIAYLSDKDSVSTINDNLSPRYSVAMLR